MCNSKYFHSIVGITLSLTLLGIAFADDGARKLTAGQRSVLADSAAWAAIAPLNDGSLGVTYQVATPVDGTDTVHVAMVWVRSSDGGRTWSKPVVVADRRADDGKMFETREDGGKIIFAQRNQAMGQ